MLHHDPVGGQALGLGQLDVVAARNLEHGIAHDQHRRGQVVEGSSKGRQHQVVQKILAEKHLNTGFQSRARCGHAAGGKEIEPIT